MPHGTSAQPLQSSTFIEVAQAIGRGTHTHNISYKSNNITNRSAPLVLATKLGLLPKPVCGLSMAECQQSSAHVVHFTSAFYT